MAKKTSPKIRKMQPEPIVFYGEPYRLMGKLPVENRSDRPVRKMRFPIQKSKLQISNGAPLNEIVIRKRLTSGQATTALASLALDRFTPPGVHKANIVINDRELPVVFHVAESLEVELAPREIYIKAKPGSILRKTIFVTNRGNVPITCGDFGVVGLEETDMVCRSIRAAVRQLKEVTLDTALKALAKELGKAYAEGKALVVRAQNKTVQVPPGDTIALELEIVIPKLPKGHEYVGYLSSYNDDIALIIQTV